MTTWQDMAAESARAANRLVRDDLVRSGVSRAYFAAYSAVTARVHEQGMTMFGDQANPPHRAVTDLIDNNLSGLRPVQRDELLSALRRLYKRRIVADYEPRDTVDRRFGHESLRDMDRVDSILSAGGR